MIPGWFKIGASADPELTGAEVGVSLANPLPVQMSGVLTSAPLPITVVGGSGQTTMEILNTNETSNYVTRGIYTRGGIEVPSNFQGTKLTYQVGLITSLLQTLYDENGYAPVSVTVQPSFSYAIPSEVMDWPYFRAVSDAPQTSDMTINVLLRS